MRSLLLLMMALALPASAGDNEHTRPVRQLPAAEPWMTGDELIKTLSRPAVASDAQRYIEGVHDATEHKDWCYTDFSGRPTPKMRPAEMQAYVLAQLRKMPALDLKRNAAQLLLKIWQDKWPCPPDGCCRD